MARRRKPDPDEELDPDQLEELEAEGAFDSRGLLKDGRSTRVSLYMRDGSPNPRLTPTQRSIAATNTEDAVSRRFGLTDGLQLHRPGFRRSNDLAALERVQQAYNDAEAADREAWRNPRRDAEHTGGNPSKPRRSQDAMGLDAKQAAYEQYDREMAVAYLRGK